MATEILGTIGAILVFFFLVALCCSGDSDSSNSTSTPRRNVNTQKRRTVHYSYDDYGECPSCGAPGYDGYCEECGYPDINQGWIGENY